MTTTPQDHGALALAELPSQFDDSARLRGLISAFIAQLQTIEDTAQDILALGTMATAEGAVLDRWGDLVRVRRGGRTDDEYRRLIQVRIAARRAGGTAESILSVVSILADDAPVYYTRIGTAAYYLEIQTVAPMTDQQVEDVLDALETITAAGVGYGAVEAGSATPFEFEGGSGFGFGVGELAHAIT